MQTLVDKTPRQLANDYYNGLITREQYLIRRRQIIDLITADPGELQEAAEAATQPRPTPGAQVESPQQPVEPPPAPDTFRLEWIDMVGSRGPRWT